MFFGYLKKATKNQPVVFGREINTDTKNKILSLKRGRVFTFDKEAFKNYAHRHPIVIGYGAVAVIAIVILISSTTSKATLAYFYPSSCLGGWEYPSNAEGEPSLADDAKRSEYNEDNSARMRGSSEIYCGSFEGQIPETAQATSFKVAFSISIDDGSVEHIKEEAKKIIDGEDLNMDSSNSDAESDTTNENVESNSQEENISNSGNTEENLLEQTESNLLIDDGAQSDEPKIEQEPEQIEAPASESVGLFKLFAQTVFAEGEEIVVEDSSVVESNTDEVQSENIEENIVVEDTSNETTEELITETNEVQTDINSEEENISDSENNESENVSVVPADAVLEAFYSLDGAEWISFGYIRMNDWEEARYDIPLSEWNDLSVVQVKLEPLPSYDQSPVVYLDSVVIEVEYAGTEDDVLAQPDFRTDTVLIDTVVDDIRVIKILRDGVPMIWYTKLPPPPEVVEVLDVPEIILIEGTEPVSDQDIIEVDLSEDAPLLEPETNVIDEPQQTSNDSVGDVPTEPLTFGEKVKSIFKLEFAFAEGESGGDSGSSGGGDSSSSSGSTSESSGDSSSSSDSSTQSTSNDSTESSDTSSNEELGSFTVNDGEGSTDVSSTKVDSIVTDIEKNDIFDSISIPSGQSIIVDDIVRDNIKNLEDIDITTTEEIVPGVIAIYYSEEQIQKEIAKNLEWNFVASGDMVDIATPIDISGGKIFWFSRDKISLNEYNTNSGSISSQTVNPEKEVEVKYLEPNGDVSEITIDPADLEITTPLEEENGVQTSIVPDFESEDSVKSENTESNIENIKQSNVE